MGTNVHVHSPLRPPFLINQLVGNEPYNYGNVPKFSFAFFYKVTSRTLKENCNVFGGYVRQIAMCFSLYLKSSPRVEDPFIN
jgi:hypothetical protein